MPAALQLVTIVLIFSLLSRAVLAVVVTQIPLIALGSQAGVGGGVGVGVGVVPPLLPEPDLVQAIQILMKSTEHSTFRKRLRVTEKKFCMKQTIIGY